MHRGPTGEEMDDHSSRLPSGIGYPKDPSEIYGPPKRRRNTKVKTTKRKPENKIDRILGSKHGRL